MLITVWNGKQKTIYECHEGETLYDTFVRYGTGFYGACGGTGRCLKCRIRIRRGEIPITAVDEKAFTREELENGCRLACKARPYSDCEIEMLYTNSGNKAFAVISEFELPKDSLHNRQDAMNSQQNIMNDPLNSMNNLQNSMNNRHGKDLAEEITNSQACKEKAKGSYLIAVDIGTTTIAMQLSLVNLKDNAEADFKESSVVKTYSSLNPQIKYGTDIMARIRSSVKGEKQQLTNLIRKELKQGIEVLMKEIDPEFEEDLSKAVVVTGNTTMLHILMGYSLDTLGVYPFEPVSLKAEQVAYSELFGTKRCEGATAYEGAKVYDAAVYVMPGISAFVGADIVAGLLALQLDKTEKINILVDLGTNGEMVIGNKQRLLCTSTAAGPAFEGGNIKCGIGSVSGAICGVTIQDNRNAITTIKNGSPNGICGTGIVETIAEFIKAGIIDETGLMKEPYFTEGYLLAETENREKIQIIQKDIREFQMAKAAIAAGIKTLIKSFGISCEDIDRVYLAGGFGWQMNIEKAVRTGLIPKELKDKIVPVGNSALHGALLYGISEIKKKQLKAEEAAERAADECSHIKQIAEEINLAEDLYFRNQYIKEMNFICRK